MFKALVILCILLGYAYDFATAWLDDRWEKKHALPESVRDIYDEKEYQRWKQYSAEKKKLRLVSGLINLAVLLGMFLLDGFAALSRLLPAGEYANALTLMTVWMVITELLDLPFSYYNQMKIEEKYGFNRSSKKTFFLDALKNYVISTGLFCGLIAVAIACHKAFGSAFFLVVYAALAVFMLAVNTFSLTFMKIFNKFDPLPEGTLRDRLTAMFTQNGYQLKNIWVMNASKRTTKANAFCAGLGKYKEIALYDNLVDNFTEDEILAVFAHELTHFKHNDTRVLTILNLIQFLPAALLIYLMAVNPQPLGQLGFEGVHFGMILITVMEAALMPIMTILSVPINAISRRCERRADAYAARIDLGEAMVSALKKLARGNFS
ncbi:MAG: M48 family metallopeptidase, partial [Clostridia bacterium]|nr:M48 family metallopeptidase [Clostridia bacterium]